MNNGEIERIKRKVNISLVCISIILGVGLYFLFRYIIFGGNAVKVYPDGLMSRGPVPDFVFAVAVSISLIYACLNLTVGRIIINRFSVDDSGAGFKKPSYVPAVVTLLVAFTFSYAAHYGSVAFTDSRLIIPEPSGYNSEYDNLTVYKAEYFVDEIGQLRNDSDSVCYVLYNGKEFYDMPIMNLGESQEKKIADLFSEHNVKIVNVATTDKIPDYRSKE